MGGAVRAGGISLGHGDHRPRRNAVPQPRPADPRKKEAGFTKWTAGAEPSGADRTRSSSRCSRRRSPRALIRIPSGSNRPASTPATLQRAGWRSSGSSGGARCSARRAARTCARPSCAARRSSCMDIAGDPPLAAAHRRQGGRSPGRRRSRGGPALVACRKPGIWIYDDMAYNDGPMFSPKSFERVLLPAFRRMIAAYKARRRAVRLPAFRRRHPPAAGHARGRRN